MPACCSLLYGFNRRIIEQKSLQATGMHDQRGIQDSSTAFSL